MEDFYHMLKALKFFLLLALFPLLGVGMDSMACHCPGVEPIPGSICPNKVKILLGTVGSAVGFNYLYDVTYETWRDIVATTAILGLTVWLNRYVQREARLQELPVKLPLAVGILTSMGSLAMISHVWSNGSDETEMQEEL